MRSVQLFQRPAQKLMFQFRVLPREAVKGGAGKDTLFGVGQRGHSVRALLTEGPPYKI